MSLSQIKRYQAGDVVGYITVLRLVDDHTNYAHRLYEVRLDCCGRVVERSQKLIRKTATSGASGCASCAAKKRMTGTVRQPVVVGEVIGPITVIRPGATALTKWIRWACCGKEEMVGHERLHRLRSDARRGNTHEKCWACYTHGRYGTQPRPRLPPPSEILPKGIISAAVAWPRPRLGA